MQGISSLQASEDPAADRFAACIAETVNGAKITLMGFATQREHGMELVEHIMSDVILTHAGDDIRSRSSAGRGRTTVCGSASLRAHAGDFGKAL